MKYLPFLSGIYTTLPGLTPLGKAANPKDRNVFQVDETYTSYIQNKEACRTENIRKYFCEHDLRPETIALINAYIADRLVKEHPGEFETTTGKEFELLNKVTNTRIQWDEQWLTVKNASYLSLFDALCSQVQEDLAICQLQRDGEDYLAAIHLCAPNHWAPADKIGKPFHAVHATVPAMERTIQHYKKMLESIVQGQGPFTRFAWGIATDTRLNHHPAPPPGVDIAEWNGRNPNTQRQWYVRTERQNLVGFPEANAFLFTIRTYFYSVDDLLAEEKKQLVSALKSMSPEVIKYKGLSSTLDLLLQELQ